MEMILMNTYKHSKNIYTDITKVTVYEHHRFTCKHPWMCKSKYIMDVASENYANYLFIEQIFI